MQPTIGKTVKLLIFDKKDPKAMGCIKALGVAQTASSTNLGLIPDMFFLLLLLRICANALSRPTLGPQWTYVGPRVNLELTL